MKFSFRALLIIQLSLLLLVSCKGDGTATIDQGVVIAEKAEVRNSTAPVAAPLKELKRGEQVEILEHRSVNQRDFTRVRVAGEKPLEGWLEARFVISKRIVDECQKLSDEWKDIPTQATGRTKDRLKLRLKPGRDTDVATMLPANTVLEIVGRERAERRTEATEDKPAPDEGVKYDNWYKVRLNPDGVIKAGWIYADSVELRPPDAIAPLPGAGRRFTAWQPFGKVKDSVTNNEESHYIILDKYAYSKDDDIDFDRIYIVVWDEEKHAYSSIFIESLLRGTYPLRGEQKSDGYYFTVPLLNRQNQPTLTNYVIKRDEKAGRYRVTRIVETKTKAKGK